MLNKASCHSGWIAVLGVIPLETLRARPAAPPLLLLMGREASVGTELFFKMSDRGMNRPPSLDLWYGVLVGLWCRSCPKKMGNSFKTKADQCDDHIQLDSL